MRKSNRWILGVLALLLGGNVLAGCGGGAEEPAAKAKDDGHTHKPGETHKEGE